MYDGANSYLSELLSVWSLIDPAKVPQGAAPQFRLLLLVTGYFFECEKLPSRTLSRTSQWEWVQLPLNLVICFVFFTVMFFMCFSSCCFCALIAEFLRPPLCPHLLVIPNEAFFCLLTAVVVFVFCFWCYFSIYWFFGGYFGCSGTSCKPNTDVLSPYKVDVVNAFSEIVAHLHLQQTQSNISLHLELCFCKSTIYYIY